MVKLLLSYAEEWTFSEDDEVNKGTEFIENILNDINVINNTKYRGASWSNMSLDGATNLICFSTGAGNGEYKSYCGYSEDGVLAEFLTDCEMIGEPYKLINSIGDLFIEDDSEEASL